MEAVLRWQAKNPNYQAEWRARNLTHAQARERAYGTDRKTSGLQQSVKKQHGLLDHEYLALKARGRCGLCATSWPGPRDWQVDHDHSCCPGNFGCRRCVRDILCPGCNIQLGSVEKFLAMGEIALAEHSHLADYLERRYLPRDR